MAVKVTSLRLPRIYYGWIIVLGLMLVSLASNAMAGPQRSLYIKPMTTELGFGQYTFGVAQSIQLVIGNLTAPIRGRIIDRYGARVPLAVAGLLTGLFVVLFSRITAGWQVIALWAFVGIIGLQAGQLYTSVPVAKWFVRRRARAMSLVFLGIPIGVMLWSPVVQWLITNVGWRNSYLIMGIAGGLPIIVVSLLIVRKQPEDYGLLPDGDAQPSASKPTESARKAVAEYPWTRAEAVRNPQFWIVSLAFGVETFAVGSLVIFRIPYFIDKGFAREMVALALSMEGVSAIMVALVLGFLLEKANVRLGAMAGFSIMLLSIVATVTATSTWQMFLAFYIFGMAIATLNVVQNTMWPAYFGRANVGAIRGAAMLVTLPFAALGAPVAGRVYDITGTYYIAWAASAACLILGIALLLLSRVPKPKLG